MGHAHPVTDMDVHFEIDAVTRKIQAKSGKSALIQGDHNSEVFTFRLPRLIDGHDMSKCNSVQVHYINVDSTTKAQINGVYAVEDMRVDPEDENAVVLSWLISQNATKYAGILSFIVKFMCVDGGAVSYVWNTAIFTGISISNGIDNSGVIVEEYADVLAQWEVRLDTLEQGGASDEQIGQAVADYLKDNPVQTGGDSSLLVVTFTTDESGKHTPSHTYAQIKEWVDNGGSAVLTDGKVWYNLATVSASLIRFERTVIAESGSLYVYYVISMIGEMTKVESVNYGGSVELDTSLTQSGKAADAKAVGDKLSEITGISLIEPAEDDIPKVFFGGALQQTKTEAVVPFRYISNTQDISGYAEIKAQGNSSLSYPKKNQTVKMFKDAECTEKLKVDFKGWGKQNKHVYKANWIDLTHARNVVSARLWGDVVKSRANYAELPELLRTSPNQGAVDGFPIKVYAEGIYQGRYSLNIPKDGWMANMDKKLDAHCILCGEGYLSGCFREASVSQWTDELHDTMPSAIRTRWLEVINFVMNSTDDDFRANIGQYFDVPSLIDYHLFGLLSCGLDAYGKNQLYLTYDGQKWFASMYDMDSTWGLYWNGSRFVATDYPRTSYEDYVSTQADGRGNLLYIRLEQCFYEELQSRWAELKNGVLAIENIINRFERYTDIAPLDLVREDYATTTGGGKFTGIPSQSTNNIQQIRSFALARQVWVDEYVEGLIPEIPVPCTGVTLSAEKLTFTAEGTQTLTATVTPNGCTDTLTWKSNNTSVATVVNGVVTAVANGSAIITATCGEHSASCTVSVSGIFEPVPCTGISLDRTELSFTETGSQTIIATVMPTDTTDVIVWSSDNESVAIVENGVVTAAGNGSANITATCGDYSAICTVSVSGIIAPPKYPFVNGTKTFSNGTVLTISNGNHVNMNAVYGDNHHICLSNISKNSDNVNAASNKGGGNSTTALFTLKAGDKVRTFITRTENHTANRVIAIPLVKVGGGEMNLFSDTAVDVDNTITMTTDMSVAAIGFWTNPNNSVYDFDVEIYVNDVRYV